MPKTESASYFAARSQLRASPVYVARAFSVKAYGDGADFPFSRDFASGPVNGGDDILQVLGTPSGNTQTVQTELGTSSIGTFTLPLLDVDGEIMRYLSNPARLLAAEAGPDDDVLTATGPIDGYPGKTTLLIDDERIRCITEPTTGRFIWCQRGTDGTSRARHLAGAVIHNGEQLRAGQRIQLYAGYADVPFVHFLKFAKMEIVATALAPDGVTFVLTVADVQRSLRKAIFTAVKSDAQLIMSTNPITIALRLMLSSGTAVDISGTCQVLAGNIVKGTSDFTLFQVGDYVLIDIESATEQLAQIGQILDATSFISSLPLTPTAAGKRFRKAGSNGKYDVLRRSDSLAMPPVLVDVAGLEALREQHFPDDHFHFRLNGPENDGKTFLEREIWRPNNCYPFITQDGKYSAKRYTAAPADVVKTLTEDDIVTWAWDGGERQILNEVDFFYDWNTSAIPNAYATRQRYTSAPHVGSIQAFGLRPPLRLELKGVRTAAAAQQILDERAFQLLQRFSAPPPILRVTVLYTHHTLDIGDTVRVTHSLIPNRKTGSRGLADEIFEVRDITPMFGATGRIGITLLHTGAQEIIPTPTSDGAQLAPMDLLVFRASFFNAASVTLTPGNTEIETGSVTVTTQRSGDTLHIQARQYVTSAAQATTPADVFSRLRVGSVAGTLLDGVSPESFLATTATKTTADQYARRGQVKHEVLYTPATVGPITIVLSGMSATANGTARDRSMTITVRSH